MEALEDAGEASGVRAAQVCQACRIRHRKCDWNSEACQQCQIIGLECVRQPAFRFRYDPKQTELAGASPNSQKLWTLPKAPLRFYDETPDLHSLYTDVTGERTNSSRAFTNNLLLQSPAGNPQPDESNSFGFYLSPSDLTSPEIVTGQSPGTWAATQPFTSSEAVLVRNFVDKMALWSDATDPARSFELEVPRRALTEPLLRHAICAFSARHFYRDDNGQEGQAEALDHQNKCLELLIPAMSGGQKINDSILAAVAILRQNEERDEDDNRFHLEGISRILNTVPDFAAAGGLGEAAAWLCLRNDIYISLTTQSPINIRLESFRDSASFRQGNDHSWANRMVLYLALLLNRAFSESVSRDDLIASEAEIAEWNRSKPVSYRPIHFKPRSLRDARPFPEIWMLATHHAVGLQYFHIAQIVLCVLRQGTSLKPYDHFVENRTKERQVRDHLRVVVGLAISNDRAENIFFTASHCLSVWGECLRKSSDRQAALQFLEDMGVRCGWKATSVVESLRRQWEDDSDSG